MTGTAVLYLKNRQYKILENIDRITLEEILADRKEKYGAVQGAVWMEKQIDWEFGY